jgi:hypothetical protein
MVLLFLFNRMRERLPGKPRQLFREAHKRSAFGRCGPLRAEPGSAKEPDLHGGPRAEGCAGLEVMRSCPSDGKARASRCNLYDRAASSWVSADAY